MGHTVGIMRFGGFVQHRVKLQMASILRDKAAHVLGLGLDFTPPVDEYCFTSARIRR